MRQVTICTSAIVLSLLIAGPAFGGSKNADPLAERERDLARRSAEDSKRAHELEAHVNEKAAKWAKTAESELEEDVLKNALRILKDCLSSPKQCARDLREKPDVTDEIEFAKKFGKMGADLYSDFIDLQTEYNENEARRLETEFLRRHLQRDHRPIPEPPAPQKPPKKPPKPEDHIPPPQPPPDLAGLTDEQLEHARDEIDEWCFQNRGDRCFEGNQNAFARFANRHPYAQDAYEAAYSAPDLDQEHQSAKQSKTSKKAQKRACEQRNAALSQSCNLASLCIQHSETKPIGLVIFDDDVDKCLRAYCPEVAEKIEKCP